MCYDCKTKGCFGVVYFVPTALFVIIPCSSSKSHLNCNYAHVRQNNGQIYLSYDVQNRQYWLLYCYNLRNKVNHLFCMTSSKYLQCSC